jgi:DNA-binding response OmpR family regulator
MMNTEALATRKIPRIVFLEDERSLCRLIEHCLQDWFEKIELVEFGSGDEAWQELTRNKPDLLIMDWKHPGLTGHEVLKLLALDQATFPVLLTSEFFEEHLQLFSDQGLTLRYLPKPFHIREFWAAVNELIGPSDYPDMQALVETQVLA